MFTFNKPCLRWKLVAAIVPQIGWPGFVAPNVTRYLSLATTISVDWSQLTYVNGSPLYPGGYVNTWTITASYERETGAATQPITTPNTTIVAPGYDFQYPYGQDANNLPTGWQVSEKVFTRTILTAEPPLLGNVITTIQMQLDNEYTMEQLDDDVDALLATVDLNSQPWNTYQYIGRANPVGPYTPTGDARQMLPNNYGYSNLPRGGISEPAFFGAAACSIFAPGLVMGGNWFANAGLKMIGNVAMAGTFCKRTFTIDYNQTLLNEMCLNGIGSCATGFEVTPPSLAPGQNTYILIVPNCQCGT